MLEETTKERLRRERETARRAECFGRLMLRNARDEHGRSLLDFAERAADRAAMQWEKTIAWMSLALHADGVNETTLTGIGFEAQEVRHAAVVQPLENESALEYAERLGAQNDPEVFAVGEAMLDEGADTNPTVPAGTTEADRKDAIGRLQDALTRWAKGAAGDKPPRSGISDARPTTAGLSDALRRLEHHGGMIDMCLGEMQRGPGNATWGIAERLSVQDLQRFLTAAATLAFNAAAILIETSHLTTTPATKQERENVVRTTEDDTRVLAAIASTASTLYEIATRLQAEIPAPTDDGQVH